MTLFPNESHILRSWGEDINIRIWGDTIHLLKGLLLYCEYSLNGYFKYLFKLTLYCITCKKIETRVYKISRERSRNLHLSQIMLRNTCLYENKLPFFFLFTQKLTFSHDGIEIYLLYNLSHFTLYFCWISLFSFLDGKFWKLIMHTFNFRSVRCIQ